MTLISGYTGEHPDRGIEAAAIAPYPCAGDLKVNGVSLSDVPHLLEVMDQAYDFSCAELTTRFRFQVGDICASVEVLTFCDRVEPALVCQEIGIVLDASCAVELSAIVDANKIDGRALRHMRATPGESKPACDGALLWESAGGLSTCGVAYVTEMLGAGDVEPARPPLGGFRLNSTYSFRARKNRRYRLRQMVCMVPNQMHSQPDFQASRLVCLNRKRGFEAVRAGNREAWDELWKGRIHLIGAAPRWQAMADAAVFYLLTSTHTAAAASTSIFGLATWHDYHYYYGHVMWDIDTFIIPILNLLQPGAAESMLEFRWRSIEGAASNARLRGRRGLQFPWESSPSRGEECAPLPGSASWHEDHVSLDVAHAFALHAHMSGDAEFLRSRAWPVLAGVAKWIESRVTATERGYEIKAAMGIAEREQASDNSAFTNMSAAVVLRDTVWAAERLGHTPNPMWSEMADKIALPCKGPVVVSHDGFKPSEEKGHTPDPLLGIFPLGYPMAGEVQQATLKFYLDLADGYIGSPMLSALYGVWAAYAGDRELSAKLMEDGYGKFCVGRFLQTLEYRKDVFPEQPSAGPFFANLSGFLYGLLMGFPGVRPGPESLPEWSRRSVVLPAGWKAIEVERLWIRGQPTRLEARHGAERAILQSEGSGRKPPSACLVELNPRRSRLRRRAVR
ncbi:MAG: glycoside hydrolase family 65 protein [Methylobacteriaceae bacterium]|nr:glycoside hydrolase family 65 protein [Methylobacteriaceae bacterium]